MLWNGLVQTWGWTRRRARVRYCRGQAIEVETVPGHRANEIGLAAVQDRVQGG